MEYKQAKAYAYRRLALKNQLTVELQEALAKKGVVSEDSARIIEELTTIGLLNDASWTESFIRREVQKKNGRGLILRKLKAKGIHSSQSLELVSNISTSKAQKEGILRLLETKYRKRDLSDFKEKQKVMASLFRKGFDIELIRNVLASYTQDLVR